MLSQTDREVSSALRALDKEALDRHVRPWLFSEESVPDLLRRRHRVVEQLES